MTESCRLITTEQYKEWKASEKKLEIAIKALKDIKRFTTREECLDNYTRWDVDDVNYKCVEKLKEMEGVK